MYIECKIKNCGPGRQLAEISLRCKNKDFICIQTWTYPVEEWIILFIWWFQYLPHFRQPCVKTSFPFYALIFKMGSKTFFRYFVHSNRAYLHFHPFSPGTNYSGVQRFIAIRLWNRNPVAQSAWIGLVQIRDNGINPPAIRFLILLFTVQYYPYGEKIIDFFKFNSLLFHFKHNGMNWFSATFNREPKALV